MEALLVVLGVVAVAAVVYTFVKKNKVEETVEFTAPTEVSEPVVVVDVSSAAVESAPKKKTKTAKTAKKTPGRKKKVTE